MGRRFMKSATGDSRWCSSGEGKQRDARVEVRGKQYSPRRSRMILQKLRSRPRLTSGRRWPRPSSRSQPLQRQPAQATKDPARLRDSKSSASSTSDRGRLSYGLDKKKRPRRWRSSTWGVARSTSPILELAKAVSSQVTTGYPPRRGPTSTSGIIPMLAPSSRRTRDRPQQGPHGLHG